MHARRRRLEGGFTLAELATIVVIVGVLSVLAVVSYRRHVATARMAEATDMSAAIRKGREAFKAERGICADISNSLDSFYPATTPGRVATQWGGPCSNCRTGDGWNPLNIHPSGPVTFGYAAVAGIGGGAFMGQAKPRNAGGPLTSAFASPGPITATDPFFVSVAWGDSDGNGVPCIVTAFSFSSALLVQSEGE